MQITQGVYEVGGVEQRQHEAEHSTTVWQCNSKNEDALKIIAKEICGH